jgi:hypothetical protein
VLRLDESARGLGRHRPEPSGAEIGNIDLHDIQPVAVLEFDYPARHEANDAI